MSKLTRVTVFRGNDYGTGEWPPTNAKEFFEWFRNKLDMVPTEYQDQAEIEFESHDCYGEYTIVELMISYKRPETKSERDAREMQERSISDEVRQRELTMLAELKAKYEVTDEHSGEVEQ